MKKTAVKMIALLVAIGCIMGGFSVSAEPVKTQTVCNFHNLPFESSKPENAVTATTETLYDVMLNAILNHADEVDVTKFNLSQEDGADIFYDFFYTTSEAFVLYEGNMRYSQGKILAFTFTYYDTKAVADAKLARYYKEIDKLVAAVPENLTDVGKVLFLHDYLVTHYEYDMTEKVFDAYTFLVTGKGGCQSYSKVFYAVMKRLGFEVYNVSSYNINHMWNVIRLGNHYYHVDMTYDDPTADRLGYCAHDYFLLSDTALYAVSLNERSYRFPNGEDRSDWLAYGGEPACNSKQYDTGYAWENSDRPLVWLDGTWYVMQGNIVSAVNSDLKTKRTVYTQPDNQWLLADQSGYYFIDFFGGFYAIGDALYGNTQTGLWSYRPSTGESRTVAIPSIDETSGIFGSMYSDGILRLQYESWVLEDPQDANSGVIMSGPSARLEIETPRLLNPTFSTAQAVVDIKSFVLGGTIDHSELLDMNQDGVVNVIDLVRMKKRLAA